MTISNYMNGDWIVLLETDTRDEALKELVNLLYQKQQITDPDVFYHAIIEREKIVSTGIGMGFAIPHAKLPQYSHFFIAVGILKKPIDWNSPDNTPVRCIFLIGGPDDKPMEYLQILSQLTHTIEGDEKRELLFNFTDPKKIMEIF